MTEAWFYDPASRTLYDENRLAVARDVGIDDANRILKAVGCETECAIIGEAQPSPLFAILADMLAYEAAKFDAEPVEFDVYDAAEKRSRGGFKSREEAEAAARQIPGAVVLDVYDDLDVSGADLVDAFTAWREQLKAALATARPAPLVALAREAAALFREYEAHHERGAAVITADMPLKEERLAKAKRNAEIASRLEQALGVAWLGEAWGQTNVVVTQTGDEPPAKRQLFISIEGGLINAFYSPDDMSDLQIITVDYDDEGIERERLTMVEQQTGPIVSAYIVTDHEIERRGAPAMHDAMDATYDEDFA